MRDLDPVAYLPIADFRKRARQLAFRIRAPQVSGRDGVHVGSKRVAHDDAVRLDGDDLRPFRQMLALAVLAPVDEHEALGRRPRREDPGLQRRQEF